VREAVCLLAVWALCACAHEGVEPGEAASPTGVVRGEGARYCHRMDEAALLISEQRHPEAEAVVDEMLRDFEAYARKREVRLVSIANETHLRDLQRPQNGTHPIQAVDWCYRELIHWKAYLRAEQADYRGAMAMLEWEARVAPTAAVPHIERGYILSRSGQFERARSSYEAALELSDRYPVSPRHRPLALRGLGAVLVELGDLDAAEQAFGESLELEPGNELAIRSLKNIQGLRIRLKQY